MSNKILTYLLIFLTTAVNNAFAQEQEDDYYTTGFTRYDNHVYRESIKTVIFERAGVQLSDPFYELGSGQRLIMKFDDLDGDYKNYSFTVIHCDASWNPSNLIENEYLNGFFEERIYDYRQSFNTIQEYTHYRFLIPGRDIIPKVSGNYLLKVYEDGYPDKPVITRRFIVYEKIAGIEGYVKRATMVADRDTKQEIDFSVFHPSLPVTNAFSEIKVLIMQNGRWDNAITGLKPLFLKDKELDYNYEEENTIRGGNEFRMFDTRTIRMQTQWVDRIVQGPDGYTVVLLPMRSRATQKYAIENDINGKYLVEYQEGNDSDLEAEYVRVKFYLEHPVMADGNFYVFGALTDWRLSNSNKMTYNYDEERYELILYLKQGYYDYQFVFLRDGTDDADESVIEGSHFETDNDYHIFVYYRPVGGRFDRVVGILRLKSF